jgi:lysine 2,3-aminomutase
MFVPDFNYLRTTKKPFTSVMGENALDASHLTEVEAIEDEPPGKREPERKNRPKATRRAIVTTPEINQKTLAFRQKYLPSVTDSEWNDWRWQIRNSYRTFSQLEKLPGFLRPDQEFPVNRDNLPLRITPYYASLIDFSNPSDPLYKSVVPTAGEYKVYPGESSDPLHENGDSPVKNLVHRYPDRVLFLTTGFCSTYCRYCTRSHMVAKEDKSHFSLKDFDPAFQYIESHPEIRDVLLSGGDPLTMSEEKLEYLLARLRAIPHVEIIRIGTKVPAVLPQRITRGFVNMLRQFHPLYLSIHFTHPAELTPEVKQACGLLADAGIPLGSQTVLLRGINDNIPTMKELMQGLLRFRVRPYYLYQCDPILGSGHFRTPVKKGLEIIRGLRGFTSGYAVPTYVIDAPGGGGKIPLLPDYVSGRDETNLFLHNYEGKTYSYPDTITDTP